MCEGNAGPGGPAAAAAAAADGLAASGQAAADRDARPCPYTDCRLQYRKGCTLQQSTEEREEQSSKVNHVPPRPSSQQASVEVAGVTTPQSELDCGNTGGDPLSELVTTTGGIVMDPTTAHGATAVQAVDDVPSGQWNGGASVADVVGSQGPVNGSRAPAAVLADAPAAIANQAPAPNDERADATSPMLQSSGSAGMHRSGRAVSAFGGFPETMMAMKFRQGSVNACLVWIIKAMRINRAR